MAIAATTAAPVKIGRLRSWIVNSGPVLGIFAASFVLWERGCWLVKVPAFMLPSALPSIFGGLKVGMGQAVVGATVGEFIAAEQGLGYLQLISQVRLDTALLFAAVVVLSLLGVLLFNLVAWVERLAVPWNRMRTEMIE